MKSTEQQSHSIQPRTFLSFQMPFQLLRVPGPGTVMLPVGVYEVRYESVTLPGARDPQSWLMLKGMDIGAPAKMIDMYLHPGKHRMQDEHGPIDTSPWKTALTKYSALGVEMEVERLRTEAEEEALEAELARYRGELSTPQYLKVSALYADLAAYLEPTTKLGNFARRAAIFWAVIASQSEYLEGLLERFALIPNLDKRQRQSWLKIVALRNR